MEIQKSVTFQVLMDVLFIHKLKSKHLPGVMFCLDQKCIVVNSRMCINCCNEVVKRCTLWANSTTGC